MTGNSIPELVFRGVCTGGSANPSRLSIYRWDGKSFHNVLQTESGECEQWITDLHHTGRYEVRSIDLLGFSDLCHTDMIRWAHIYAWNGSRFVLADAQYPEAFHTTRDVIRERLHKHPDSAELWQFLGLTYLYDHDRSQAFYAFDRAEAICLDDSDYGWSGLGALAEIRGDRPAAVSSYREGVRRCRTLAAQEKDAEDRQYYLERKRWAAERARHPHIGEISRE